MKALKKEIFSLCRDFIKVVDGLRDNRQITYEEHVQMVKLKQEYMDNMEKFK
ncbi:MAG: hypothetical protein ACOCG5_07635 [Candidatus Alkaliphilus sp. MAG34]